MAPDFIHIKGMKQYYLIVSNVPKSIMYPALIKGIATGKAGFFEQV